jgi:ADP-heptose:LPS heptosyltransferase
MAPDRAVGPTLRGALPARLLVDLPNWVGDQVMALPAVNRLVGGNTGGVTVLHCRPAVRRLLEHLFPAAEVVGSPRRASPVRLALELRRRWGRFDLAVTLRHASRAKLLLFLASRQAVGSSGGGARLLLSSSAPVDRSRHQVFDGDPLLAALDLPAVDPEWRPVLPTSLRAEGERLLAAGGVSPPLAVGLAPGAAWGSSKRWPTTRFGLLAARLQGRGLQPLVVVGPGEEQLAAEVVAAAGTALPVLGTSVDVAGLAGLLSHLAVLVGNDSGPMQLAVMVGTPVVALFGPTNPVRTGPRGTGHAVVSRGLRCAPCLEARCPLAHSDCLAGLAVAEVERAVVGVVGRKASRAAAQPG